MTTPNDQATKRPWFADDGQQEGDKLYILGPGGCYIAQLDDSEDDPYGDEKKGNAALIVEAVNAYDTLREQNQAMREALEAVVNVEWTRTAKPTYDEMQLIEKAKTALALAQAEKGV